MNSVYIVRLRSRQKWLAPLLVVVLAALFVVVQPTSAEAATCGAACTDVPATGQGAASELMADYNAHRFIVESAEAAIIPNEIAPTADGSIAGTPQCGIDYRTLQMLVIIIRNFGSVQISDLSRRCANDGVATCPSNPSSYHCVPYGNVNAVDITRVGGVPTQGNDARSSELLTYLDSFLPSGSRAGQIAGGSGAQGKPCGSYAMPALANISRFADDCTHQHVDLGSSTGTLRGLVTSQTPPPVPNYSDRSDFNGDGVSDVFWDDPTTGQWNASYGGSSNWARLAADSNAKISDMRIGDFNGDKRADIFWDDPSSGQWYVSYGGTSNWARLASAPTAKIQDMLFGDFNGDGITDVFWDNPATGQWYVSYGGTSNFASLASDPSTNISDMRVGDFNGDKRADILRVDPTSGQWYVSYGGASNWARLASAPAAKIHDMLFDDFNGDGLTDIFWDDPATGQWYVSYGGTSNWARLAFDASANISDMRVGDFNGDKQADVFRVDPTSGQWYVSYGGTSNWARLAAAPTASIQDMLIG